METGSVYVHVFPVNVRLWCSFQSNSSPNRSPIVCRVDSCWHRMLARVCRAFFKWNSAQDNTALKHKGLQLLFSRIHHVSWNVNAGPEISLFCSCRCVARDWRLAALHGFSWSLFSRLSSVVSELSRCNTLQFSYEYLQLESSLVEPDPQCNNKPEGLEKKIESIFFCSRECFCQQNKEPFSAWHIYIFEIGMFQCNYKRMFIFLRIQKDNTVLGEDSCRKMKRSFQFWISQSPIVRETKAAVKYCLDLLFRPEKIMRAILAVWEVAQVFLFSWCSERGCRSFWHHIRDPLRESLTMYCLVRVAKMEYTDEMCQLQKNNQQE